jgi:hypothetical protein
VSACIFLCRCFIVTIDDNGISENENMSILEESLAVIKSTALFYSGKDHHKVVAYPGPPGRRVRSQGSSHNTMLHKALPCLLSFNPYNLLNTGNSIAFDQLLFVDPQEKLAQCPLELDVT